MDSRQIGASPDADGEEPAMAGVFFGALEVAESLAVRLDTELDKAPELIAALSMFSSFIYGCGQKVIDRSVSEETGRALDTAVARSCSRLFTDCMGGYTLLRRGLVMPAIPVLRAALETTMQAIMFLERPSTAEEWLKGKQFKPSQARNSSPAAAALYQSMYSRLSDYAHPNVVSILFYTVPLPGQGGEALLYGAWYAPKSAGVALCEFARIELAFLRAVYAAYDSELQRLGLLFRPGSVAAMVENGYSPENPPLTWSQLFDFFEGMLERAERYFATLKDDQETWRAAVSSPETNAR